MLNASLVRTALMSVVALCASSAAAQRIETANVLDDDAVQVMAAQWTQGSARRTIPPRMAEEFRWPVARALALLGVVESIDAEGLDPADYHPQDLREAMAGGPGVRLDNVAGAIFTWLAQDLRDGRTPDDARRSYLMDDPDAERLPIGPLMERALVTGDMAGVLASLNPVLPDYAALRDALAATPADDTERRDAIRANMDRWRWLPRDLGGIHLMVNVPEYRLRLTVNGQVLRNYRTIVGQPGRNATPQLSEMVEGVIFNPTWTVPQSIVVGEGLGRRVLNNPNWARARGYVATRGANGRVNVVQSPGPGNALGAMKLDMPNPHAIFLHDTPSKQLFDNDMRALSHGCIRVQDAMELAVVLNLLGQGVSAEEALSISASGQYTRVPLSMPVPVYIAYFTMGLDENGSLVEFDDIYDRDAPVVASLGRPSQRQLLLASR
ncbi:L,D-transpeptidase family protein [Alteraurantiacibacter aestuarii]|uniref:L,D-transpeptidase family protein n=2 Tax=Alteraurantiacibacter aestuarii TaxID=650004 RepID=A0A844ZNA0_9SPHN|nr:L,D-transpeptidase family protein [Alteraurantiacibacter aestuarii]